MEKWDMSDFQHTPKTWILSENQQRMLIGEVQSLKDECHRNCWNFIGKPTLKQPLKNSNPHIKPKITTVQWWNLKSMKATQQVKVQTVSLSRWVNHSCQELNRNFNLCCVYVTHIWHNTFKTKKEHKTQCSDDLAIGTIRYRLSTDYDYFNKNDQSDQHARGNRKFYQSF